MWASKKSKRQLIDSLILAILGQNPDGLTGYAVMKELEQALHPIPVPGTGTIYPRLDNLLEQGDLAKKGNLYILTDQGQAKISQDIENLLHNSVKNMRIFYKNLLSYLPLHTRSRFATIIPRNFQLFADLDQNGHTEFSKPIFNIDSFKCNCTGHKIASSLDDLNLTKQRLIQAKTTIMNNVEREIKAIDAQIEMVEKQIQDLKGQTQSWKKIKITDADAEMDNSEDVDIQAEATK
jgi:DNA-binding PadR family transcriptional regulator